MMTLLAALARTSAIDRCMGADLNTRSLECTHVIVLLVYRVSNGYSQLLVLSLNHLCEVLMQCVSLAQQQLDRILLPESLTSLMCP